MDQMITYPIGEASFRNLRADGAVYVDKTALIYQLVKQGRYYFLSRPRRFGKSLLVSTLEAYFRGQRELFAGLAMEGLEKEWTQHPVLRVDFSRDNFAVAGVLESTLNTVLSDWEAVYGRNASDGTYAARFVRVIENAHAQTGRPVVVLVDEYDKPMLDAVDDEELLACNQRELRGFYGALKGMGDHLRFVFLTGVTRFAHLNIFSGLNNLRDISMSMAYATLCGITQAELQANLGEGVRRLAEGNGQTTAEAYGKLKAMYDGYRFSPRAEEGVYNPFSLLNALNEQKYGCYWYESGTPMFLFQLVVGGSVPLAELGSCQMLGHELQGREVSRMGLVPLLFQAGYLTIERYDEVLDMYRLRFPNEEVERAFYGDLLQYFFPVGAEAVLSVSALHGCALRGAAEELMALLHAFFAQGDYRVAGDREVYFQGSMATVFRMLGLQTHVEMATSDGRIDMVVATRGYVYLFEVKRDRPAAEAMAQIEAKGYAASFVMGRRPVVKLGVSFSSKTRNIAECIVREEGKADVRMGVVDGKLQAVGE